MSEDHRPPQPNKLLEELFQDTQVSKAKQLFGTIKTEESVVDELIQERRKLRYALPAEAGVRLDHEHPESLSVAPMSDDELERFALKARWAVSPVEDTDDDTKAAVAIGFVREILPQIMRRFSEMRTRGAE